MPLSSTQRVAKTVLDKETNARFWAQTGYKPGQKLDPVHNPIDKSMSKVWLDIFAKVKAEDAAGKLVLTYNNRAVEQHLDAAAAASSAALGHMNNADAAAAAGQPAIAAEAIAAAAQAHQAAHDAMQVAAAMQPPTVSPQVAQVAATEAAQIADQPAPPPLNLPPQHAGNSVAARPARPLEFFNALEAELDAGKPQTVSDHLDVAAATAAPARAASVHHVAQHMPKPTSSLSSDTIAQIRAEANAQALQQMTGDHPTSWIGVANMPDGTWTAVQLPSREALDGWYGELTNHPDTFTYAAAFDMTTGDEPINELFGSGQAIPVNVTVDHAQAPELPLPQEPPSAPVVAAKGAGIGAAAALGAVAVAGVAMAFAGRGKKKGRR